MNPKVIVIEVNELEQIVAKVVKEAIEKVVPPEKDQFADYPEWLTRRQTANILNICLSKLDLLAKEGRIQRYRNQSLVRFKKEEIVAFYKTYEKWAR